MALAYISDSSLSSENTKTHFNDTNNDICNEEDINDDDFCCPICYQLYAVNCLDDGANADANIGEEDTCDAIIGIHIDTERHQDCDALHSAPGISSNSRCAENREAHPIGSAPYHHCHKNRHQITQQQQQQQDGRPNNNNTNNSLSRKHPKEKLTIPGCEHEFCRGCLRDHCSYSISVRNVPIRCPKILGDGGSCRHCSVFLRTDLVEDLLLSPTKGDETNSDINDDNWIKFQRLNRMSEDLSLIPCTRCDELVSPDDISNDDDPNRIRCPACQHVFCRFHGDGVYCTFSGTKLRDSNVEQKEQEKQSEKAIRELCKPCSHCGIPFWKEDGCDHVVCPICKNDMCFRCGTHEYLETSGSARAIRTCRACNKSYIDHRYLWRHRMRLLAKLPLMLPIYFFYVAMTMSLAVATGGCFCCLGCGVRWKKLRTKAKETETSNSKFTIVWMPVMAMREVLGWVLEPLIDLFHDCGFECCFCNNAPELCKGGRTDDVDYDSYNHSDEESELTEGDIESQTIQR